MEPVGAGAADPRMGLNTPPEMCPGCKCTVLMNGGLPMIVYNYTRVSMSCSKSCFRNVIIVGATCKRVPA